MWKKLKNMKLRKQRIHVTTDTESEGLALEDDNADLKDSLPTKSMEAAVSHFDEDACTRYITFKKKMVADGVLMLKEENETRRRRINEILALDSEVGELQSLVRKVQYQNAALEEEVLRKKGELGDLMSQVDSDQEAEVKKHVPTLYEKYCNIQTSTQASDFLELISQRQKALKTLHTLTYSKHVSLKHHLKSNSVQQSIQRDIVDFGWLFESPNDRPVTPPRPPALKRKLTLAKNTSSDDVRGETNLVTISVKSDTALSIEGRAEQEEEKGSEGVEASTTPPTVPPRPVLQFPQRPLPFLNELMEFGPSTDV